MIDRKQKELTLQQYHITVWEANWDMTEAPEQINKLAKQTRASLNGTGHTVLMDFYESVYPWLAGHTTGEVPTYEQAFALGDRELDEWYLAVRETNPHLFPNQLPDNITVSFRDGSQLVIQPAHLPSVLRRMFTQEQEAKSFLEEHPDDVREFARRRLYDKMACCSIGNVPSFKELMNWPVPEANKWYEAVLKVNSHLFLTATEVVEKEEQEALADTAKKKSSRKRSSSS